MKRGVFLVAFMFSLLLVNFIYGTDLSDFPDFFITDTALNVTLVTGANAPASDLIALDEVQRALKSRLRDKVQEEGVMYRELIRKKLDVEVTEPQNKNLVIIGMPPSQSEQSNVLLFEKDLNIKSDSGKIILEQAGAAYHLIITGVAKDDVLRAAQLLKNLDKLRGTSVDVPRISKNELMLPSQPPICGDQLCEAGKGENIIDGPYYCKTDCEVKSVQSNCQAKGGYCMNALKPCPESFGQIDQPCPTDQKCCTFVGDPKKGYFYTARSDYFDGDLITFFVNLPEKTNCKLILKDPDDITMIEMEKQCEKGILHQLESKDLNNIYGTWTAILTSNVKDQEFQRKKEFTFRESEVLSKTCTIQRDPYRTRTTEENLVICNLEDTDYEMSKKGGCGEDPITIEVKYRGIVELVQMTIGHQPVELEDGTRIRVLEAPCYKHKVVLKLERLSQGTCGDGICSIRENSEVCPPDCAKQFQMKAVDEHPQLPFFSDGIASRYELFEAKEMVLNDEVFYITFLDYGKEFAKFKVDDDVIDVKIGEYELLKQGKVQFNLHNIYEREEKVYAIVSLRGQKTQETVQQKERSASVDLCEYGCRSYGKCMPFGVRFLHGGIASYCEHTKEVLPQKENGKSCSNNYECESNTCLESNCVGLKEQLTQSKGFFSRLFDKIFSWFS